MTAEIISATQLDDGTCVFAVSYDGAAPEPTTWSPPTLEEGEEFDRVAWAETCVEEMLALVRARVDAANAADATAAAVDPAAQTPAGYVELAVTGQVIE